MSPRTKKQFETIRQQSKQNILETAKRLFSRNGYSATSVGLIAREAGISKGLLYNYYDSKEQLLLSILQQAIDMGDQIVRESFAADLSPEQTLANTIDQIFTVISRNTEYWRLIIRLSLQEGISQEVASIIESHAEMQLANASELMRQMGVAQPEKEALLLGSLIDGMALQYVGMPEKYPLKQQIHYLKQRFKLI